MQINHSLKTILFLSTKYKILYKQFTYLRNHLAELDSVNIAEYGSEVPLRKALIATTSHVMILTSESILEEFNEILTPDIFPEYKGQILLLKEEVKPAMKRFKKWSQRRLYRNSLLAHNLRLKDKKSLFSQEQKLKINAPHFNNDFAIIYYLHVYICHCIGKHFAISTDELNAETISDKIEFTGNFASLLSELPIIENWFRNSGFHYEELSNHIEFLNRK